MNLLGTEPKSIYSKKGKQLSIQYLINLNNTIGKFKIILYDDLLIHKDELIGIKKPTRASRNYQHCSIYASSFISNRTYLHT